MTSRATPLPIDASLEVIRDGLRQAQAVILVAPPGAGKTTRVPPALVQCGPLILLQPRRVAARSIARRIASEQGWGLGEEVGWQVRFDRRAGPRTRLLVATEGVLTTRLVDDPLLSSFATIVLDEFHERSHHADLALALTREALRARDDLRLVVMSASLDPEPLVRYLGDARVIEVPGRCHPVAMSHAASLAPADACERVLGQPGGHVLCFLPGMAQIRDTAEALRRRALPRETRILHLHGSMGAAEQDAVLAPCAQRKVILCTNIAETSLTVDGVTDVVDSGLHKVMRFDAARGLDRLETERIPWSSAQQRAGRAGRTAPGRALRLWDERDILADHIEPELRRIDLARPLLDVVAAGEDPESFAWLDPPAQDRVQTAVELLERLGFTENRRLTPTGRLARRLPLHPRLAAVILAAQGSRRAVRACAMLAEGLPMDTASRSCDSDMIWLLDHFDRAPRAVLDASRQIERVLEASPDVPRSDGQDDSDLRRAVLAGYPDRVGQRRAPGSRRFQLSSGIGARLSERSSVHAGNYLVALEVVAGRSRGDEAIVLQASRIEEQWLRPTSSERAHFLDREAGVVRAEERQRYHALVLSRRAVPPDMDTAQRLLAQEIEAQGLSAAGERWLARAACAGIALDRSSLVRSACVGRTRLVDVDLEAALSWDVRQRIEEASPDALLVPSGRRVPLDYRGDGRVHLAVKLQELFGWADTPAVGRPPRPVVIELLAPNGRPVQTTTDLRSFWARTYPEVRRELRGRYPKHPWPENPWTATPTSRTQRRG